MAAPPAMKDEDTTDNTPAPVQFAFPNEEGGVWSYPIFSPHMLRHVYASLQIEHGVTPKRLQKLIGHATLKITLDTYGHLWPDEDADRARVRVVWNA
ncbi:MAG: tyrosine-type recombinase/integrase [Proteobacteria bacterium]|nr:tyrosine-type recombinase/integrase [Pseudomonadota bacterium]